MATTPTPNAPLLLKRLEEITADRESWDQREYATVVGDSDFRRRLDHATASVPATAEATGCRTALCIAGGTVAAAGVTLLWRSDGTAFECIDPAAGETNSISRVAARMLGLNLDQALALFAVKNTLAMLWALAEIITDGEIVLPPAELVGEPGHAEHGRYDALHPTADELRAAARAHYRMHVAW